MATTDANAQTVNNIEPAKIKIPVKIDQLIRLKNLGASQEYSLLYLKK